MDSRRLWSVPGSAIHEIVTTNVAFIATKFADWLH
ncbi:hypothetical protein V474_07010 [Novosphingobium barchaimii LL02]|uniref:Uncharacterized protein n=1 Tax=Novosphingobium barchaimii LL02 TaxID=1114963 RepID=A0A0J7XFL1_9SPHN|nr:hypothetical protein V474_07010 [Novosphingobium barchaimii LL02]